MEEIPLTVAKYERTLLAKVGDPDGATALVNCLTVGDETVNFIMEVTDVRQMLYDNLRLMQDLDPISKKLFEAFKRVFEEKAQNVSEKSSSEGH